MKNSHIDFDLNNSNSEKECTMDKVGKFIENHLWLSFVMGTFILVLGLIVAGSSIVVFFKELFFLIFLGFTFVGVVKIIISLAILSLIIGTIVYIQESI